MSSGAKIRLYYAEEQTPKYYQLHQLGKPYAELLMA